MQFSSTKKLLTSDNLSDSTKKEIEKSLEKNEKFVPGHETEETKTLAHVLAKLNLLKVNLSFEEVSKEEIIENLSVIIAFSADLHKKMRDNIQKV